MFTSQLATQLVEGVRASTEPVHPVASVGGRHVNRSGDKRGDLHLQGHAVARPTP